MFLSSEWVRGHNPSQENRLQVAPVLSVEVNYILKVVRVRSFTLTSQFEELLWVEKGLLWRCFVVALLISYLFVCCLGALVVRKIRPNKKNPKTKHQSVLEWVVGSQWSIALEVTEESSKDSMLVFSCLALPKTSNVLCKFI